VTIFLIFSVETSILYQNRRNLENLFNAHTNNKTLSINEFFKFAKNLKLFPVIDFSFIFKYFILQELISYGDLENLMKNFLSESRQSRWAKGELSLENATFNFDQFENCFKVLLLPIN
jgi:hypothetical protein